MLQHFIQQKTIEHLGFSPTEQQALLIEKLSVFLTETGNKPLFLLKGFAGTGKTSVISAIVRLMDEIEQTIVLLAPTGRAAKVLTAYSGKQAFTIHKHIYRQKIQDGNPYFDINFNTYKNTLFVVDEASMIATSSEGVFGSGRVLDDLIEYVYQSDSNKLLLLGDTAQLPPVMQDESPALQKKYLEQYGLSVQEYTLTQVVRQAQESGILHNATLIREKIEQLTHPSQLCLTPFEDVIRVNGQNFTDYLNAAYKDGLEDTIIITRSNKKANMYVDGIRNRVLYREERIASGDLVMVVKNNYFVGKAYQGFEFIANGDIAEIIRVRNYTQLYDCQFVDVTLRFLDYDWEVDAKMLVDVISCADQKDLLLLNQKLFKAVEEDYLHIGNKRKRYKEMQNDVYLNALQVKFSYAITCHKAQGGQWRHVFVDMGMLNKENIDTGFLRWLYTACTRAKEKLYLINFDDGFFC